MDLQPRFLPAQLQRLEGLADHHDLLVIWHHGVGVCKSSAGCALMGIENCFSVLGGIDRWSREIGPKLRRD